jgi:hypothetical protein
MSGVVLKSVVLAFIASSLFAQHPAAGLVHDLRVRGWYEDFEMEPWLADYSLKDTTVDGRRATRLRFNSRRDESGSGWLFRFTAAWTADSAHIVHAFWENDGRTKSGCELKAQRGEMTGRMSSRPQLAPLRVEGLLTPDFALGPYVASRTLAERDTVRISVFSCLPDLSGGTVQVQKFTAVVKAAMATRGANTTPEPVWELTGDAGYPAVVIVAKSDRVVLRVKTPQGTVGFTETVYSGSR